MENLKNALTQLRDTSIRYGKLFAEFGYSVKALETVICQSKALEVCALSARSLEEVEFNIQLHSAITETDFEFIADVVIEHLLLYAEVPSWWLLLKAD